MREHTHLSAGPRALASTTHHTKLRKAPKGFRGLNVTKHTRAAFVRSSGITPVTTPTIGPTAAQTLGNRPLWTSRAFVTEKIKPSKPRPMMTGAQAVLPHWRLQTDIR